MALAPNGALWVSDYYNNRVLGYAPAAPPPPPPPTLYPIVFDETGVPGGITWTLSVDGTAYSSTSPQFSVNVQNGTHNWSVGSAPFGFRLVGPSAGSLVINGSAAQVNLTFVAVFTVTFTESGLPLGTNWSVTFNGTTETSTSSTILFVAENGTYSYRVGTSASGYSASPAGGTYTVSPTNLSMSVQFSQAQPSSTPPSYLLYGILGAIAAIAVALVVLLLGRRRRKSQAASPPTPVPAGTTPSSPPDGSAPPSPPGPPA